MAIVGRQQIDHPSLGTAGGAPLHSSINSIYEILSNNYIQKYQEEVSIADSTTIEVDHNFGASFNELGVLIYTGNGSTKTLVTDYIDSNWVVAAKAGELKTVLEVTTPPSGGPHTFTVIVVDCRQLPESIFALLQASPTNPTANSIKTWFDTNKRGLSLDSSGGIQPLNFLGTTYTSSSGNISLGINNLVRSNIAAVNLDAPPTIANYDIFMVSDAGRNAFANNITVGRNGNTINGVAADYVIDGDGGWVIFVGDNTNSDWIVLASSQGGGGGLVPTRITFADSPVSGVAGKFYLVDASGGDVVINFQDIVQQTESIGVQLVENTNTLTVNPHASDTLNGATSRVYRNEREWAVWNAYTASIWQDYVGSLGTGVTITEFEDYTPATNGLGTITSRLQWRQVGSSIEIKGDLTIGTSTASEARIDLPNNYTAVFTSAGSNRQIVGKIAKDAATAREYWGLATSGEQHIEIGNYVRTADTNPLAPLDGDQVGSAEVLTVDLRIPIAELQNSGTTLNLTELTQATNWVTESTIPITLLNHAGSLNSSNLRARSFVDTNDQYSLVGTLFFNTSGSDDADFSVELDEAGGSITFLSAFDQVTSANGNSSGSNPQEISRCLAIQSTNEIRVICDNTLNEVWVSFEVLLDSKPPWFDANAINKQSVSAQVDNADADNAGLMPAYEVGTWTPSDQGNTNVGAVSGAAGAYVIIGKRIQCSLTFTANSETSTTNLQNLSLPKTPAGTPNLYGTCAMQSNASDDSNGGIVLINGSDVELKIQGTGSSAMTWTAIFSYDLP